MQAATCTNCDTIISGPFCSSCGQSQKNLNKQIWTLTGELLDDVIRLDSRVVRTLMALMFRPGYLTKEYFEGRRARYSPPIRLYLIVSFLFFFLMPALTELNQAINISDSEIPEEQVTEEQVATEPTDDSIDDDALGENFSAIKLDWLTEAENKALEETLEKQIRKTVALANEEPTQLYRELMDYMSAVMFFMLPLFAIFMKISYIGSGVYYAEHLLLAVYNHCFLFIALMLSSLLETLSQTPVAPVTELLDAALLFWIPVYMFISLRTVFGESMTSTIFKFLFLVLCYVILVTFGLSIAVIIGLFTL